VHCTVEIEKSANLNVLLHRLFVIRAIQAWDDATYLSLKQNPQFYSKFPSDIKDFQSPSSPSLSFPAFNAKPISSLPYIPALNPWDPVECYAGRILHIIVDRNKSSREVVLEDLSTVQLPENYSNGWYLDRGGTQIAAREKGT